MNKFMAILSDSLLDIRDRKIFYLYWAVAIVMVLVIVLMPNFQIDGQDLFQSGMISPEMMEGGLSKFYDQFFGFMILLMVFGSAGLMPSFLTKGRIELTLSKPIDRYRLLLMKFASVYLVMCAILAVLMTIIWAALSIRLGFTYWYFFYGLLFSFVQFFAVYSLVFIFGVTTNSSAVAIMGYFVIRAGAGLLDKREAIYQLLGDSVWKTILDVIYHIMPKIGEMAGNYIPIMRGRGITDAYPVYSTLGISVVLILVTLLIFRRRDY
jgi:ABC-type transport system involved in multi-copper enzyme maturation permease subunit